MPIKEPRSGWGSWSGLSFVFAAAAGGARFSPDDWYRQLNRPAIAPPDYLFGPVWTMLYFGMAVAAWIVWKSDRLRETWPSLMLFFIQLSLNAIWSWLFFGLHLIGWALIDIVMLLGAISATTVYFPRELSREYLDGAVSRFGLIS